MAVRLALPDADARRRPAREDALREVFNGYKRKNGSKVHMAVDTLGLLPDLLVTPANEQERRQVEALGKAVQRATGNSVITAFAVWPGTLSAPLKCCAGFISSPLPS